MIFIESGNQITGNTHGVGKHLSNKEGWIFLISDSLQETVEIVDIIPSIESDHSCTLIKLRPVNENTRGRAYWKFNSSMTQDARFVDMLKKEIPYFIKEVAHHTDPIVQWES